MTRATPQLSLCSVSHHSQAVHWMEIGLVLLWLFFTYSQGVENAVADVTEWACCLLFCSEIPKKCQATYSWKDAVLALNKINIRKEFWTKRSFNCGLLWRKRNLFEKGLFITVQLILLSLNFVVWYTIMVIKSLLT